LEVVHVSLFLSTFLLHWFMITQPLDIITFLSSTRQSILKTSWIPPLPCADVYEWCGD
jgi:hypothetical protein